MLTVCVAGIALYTLAGFFLAPPLVKRWIEAVITADSGGRLEAERVTFNPYTFDVSFTNLTLYDGENKAAFSIGQSGATLDLRSLVERHPVFSGTVELTGIETASAASGDFYLAARRIAAEDAALYPGAVSIERMRVDQPEVRLRRDSAGELNVPTVLSRLLADPAAARLDFSAIDISDGRVHFSDDAVSPPSRFGADAVEGRIEIRRVDNNAATAATVKGRLSAPAGGDVNVKWQRVHATGSGQLSITAGDVALAALSPYARAVVGRPMVGGRIDLDFDLERVDGRTAADLRVATKGLELAVAGADEAADARAVDLAVALLENRDGVMRIARSLERPSAESGFEAGRILSRMLRSSVTYTARNPFEVLGSIAGRPASALRRIDFPPGSAELVPRSMKNLDALAMILERRPRLALVMRPAYDPVADRDALAEQQVRLHVILAASARPPGQADDAALNFGDEKVRGVLDEFASTRLPGSGRAAIAEQFPDRDDTYYRAIFDALVANQSVDETALRRLARYRVQSATSELVSLGVDDARLIRDDNIDVIQTGKRRISVAIDVVPTQRVGPP